MQRMARSLASPIVGVIFLATVTAGSAAFAQPASSENATRQLDERVWGYEILNASTEELARNFLPNFPREIVDHDWMRLSSFGPRYLSLYERSVSISEWVCVQKIHKMVFWSSHEIYPERRADLGIIQTNRFEDAIYQISETGQCGRHSNRIAGFSAYGVDVSNALRSYKMTIDDGNHTIQCTSGSSECITLLRSFDLKSLRRLGACNELHCLAKFDFPPSAADVKSSPYGWELKLYDGPVGRRIVISPGLQPAVS
ncbi:hypothetical protein D3C85_792100 [compost metagenome]